MCKLCLGHRVPLRSLTWFCNSLFHCKNLTCIHRFFNTAILKVNKDSLSFFGSTNHRLTLTCFDITQSIFKIFATKTQRCIEFSVFKVNFSQSHFINGKTEVEGSYISCPRSYTLVVPRFKYKYTFKADLFLIAGSIK